MQKCLFHECSNPVEVGRSKCILHRNRSQCTAAHCRNQAYARGRCARHGARKHCLMEGCTQYRRAGGYCAKHTTALRNSTTLTTSKPLAHEPLQFTTTGPCSLLSLNPADWSFVHDLLVNIDPVWTTKESTSRSDEPLCYV